MPRRSFLGCQTEHRARLEKATARCFIWSFHRLNPFCCGCWARLAERSKRSTDLFGEELRLFPRRKVPAFLDLVVMDEFGICPLCPTPRGLILPSVDTSNPAKRGRRKTGHRERALKRVCCSA